ncbi:10364_t:CDS:2, partial [Racocetra fulgida]
KLNTETLQSIVDEIASKINVDSSKQKVDAIAKILFADSHPDFILKYHVKDDDKKERRNFFIEFLLKAGLVIERETYDNKNEYLKIFAPFSLLCERAQANSTIQYNWDVMEYEQETDKNPQSEEVEHSQWVKDGVLVDPPQIEDSEYVKIALKKAILKEKYRVIQTNLEIKKDILEKEESESVSPHQKEVSEEVNPHKKQESEETL